MQKVDYFRQQRQWCSSSNTSMFCWSDRHTKWSNMFLTVMSITVSTTLKPVSVLHTKNAYETHRSHDKDLALIGNVIWVSKRKQHNEIVTVRQLSWCWCCVKEKLKESERQKENIFLCSATVNNIVSTTSALSLNKLNHNKQQKFTLMNTTWWWSHNTSALWRCWRICTQERRKLSEWIQM